ncbi:hypothetical protein CPB84DRAFT_1914346, partial [Gymnopilus junonius]
IVSQCSPEFLFGNSKIDGLILHKGGICCDEHSNMQVNICLECVSALKKDQIPKFALANNLYQGSLPAQFHDLTWVEEMICAIYHNTAHIT